MRNTFDSGNSFGVVTIAIVCTSMLPGCNEEKCCINEMNWTESVQLNSGAVLNVKRHVRFREYTALGSSGSTGQNFETSVLEWEAEAKRLVRWSAPMRPFFLDRDPQTGEWMIVAKGGSSGGFYEINGSPCPPQWAFRLRAGTWYVQPVPTELIGRRANLLFDLRVDDDMRFSEASFGVEAGRRKAQFQDRPGQYELENFVVGAIGQKRLCEGLSPQFRTPFTANETIPGIGHFPRIP